MGLRIQAAPFGLRDSGHSAVLDLFSFEEMTLLSDEARILSLPTNGNRSLADTPWLDVAGKRSSVFNLLAAHPRLLGSARHLINGPVRTTLLKIWVGGPVDATPGAGLTIAAPALGQVMAVVCLAGEARSTLAGNLESGRVLWLDDTDSLVLEPVATPLMLCAVAYGLDETSVIDGQPTSPQVADDSLWPSAYVMAG
jgi:hypothetical protein